MRIGQADFRAFLIALVIFLAWELIRKARVRRRVRRRDRGEMQRSLQRWERRGEP
jgi:hypothetical protein